MAGTRTGGLKTDKIIKAKNGQDWYERIGRRGGRAKKSGWKLSNETKAKMSAAHKARWAKRKAETFFVKDEAIGSNIIEPFAKQPWYSGWFRRSK